MISFYDYILIYNFDTLLNIIFYDTYYDPIMMIPIQSLYYDPILNRIIISYTLYEDYLHTLQIMPT
jgi:hypothetical protein